VEHLYPLGHTKVSLEDYPNHGPCLKVQTPVKNKIHWLRVSNQEEGESWLYLINKHHQIYDSVISKLKRGTRSTMILFPGSGGAVNQLAEEDLMELNKSPEISGSDDKEEHSPKAERPKKKENKEKKEKQEKANTWGFGFLRRKNSNPMVEIKPESNTEFDIPLSKYKDGIYLKGLDEAAAKPKEPGQKVKEEHFELLATKTKEIPDSEYSVANEKDNFLKNRYQNILPPNHSRVVLTDPGLNYINASFLPDCQGKGKVYIACQGPLQSTVPDFWALVYQENVSVVVMLAKLVEAGKEKVFQYWPQEKETPSKFGNYSVTLNDIEINKENTIRRFTLKKNGESGERIVTQIQYTNWPDHGVPRYTKTFLELIHLSNDSNTSKGPLLVHCSAGVGRTGTFVVVHSLMKEKVKPSTKDSNTINVFHYILELRKDRPNMIQSPDQYDFCHRAFTEYYNPPKETVLKPDSHYQKFDEIRKTVEEPAEFG